MSREVRVCELCNELNEPDLMECVKCGEDLACVPVTTIEEDINNQDTCMEKNNTSEKNISEEINCENLNRRKKTMIFIGKSLQNRVDGKIIEIPIIGCVLGRDGDVEVEYFEQFPFVSNIHASFEYCEDELVIKDEGSTNGTKVNGEKLRANVKRNIYEGDIIRLANIEFIVK